MLNPRVLLKLVFKKMVHDNLRKMAILFFRPRPLQQGKNGKKAVDLFFKFKNKKYLTS